MYIFLATSFRIITLQFDVKVFNKETDMVMICRVTLCILLKTGQNICTDVAVFSLIVTVSSVN